MTENIDRLNVDAAVSDLVNIFQHAGEPMKCKSNSSKRIHNNNKRRKPHANWWDCECQEAKETKISKLRGYRSSRSEQDFAVYLEAKKHFKRMCRKKSLDFNRTFYKDLRESTKCSNSVWSCLKKLNKKKHNTDNSTCISSEMWFDHFSKLLNTTNTLDEEFNEIVNETIIAHDTDCLACLNDDPDILNNDIEINEILSVISDLPNGKSPGSDGIVYEFIKYSPVNIITTICSLFNIILQTGNFPSQWCEAIISPLHKKGSKRDPKNYRGISLLCVIGKLFTKVLNNRLVLWAERNNKIDDAQGAYRKGRSTIDHIFSLSAIIQKYLAKRGGRFYVAFVDFSAAFDSVPHSHLWYRLIQDGIHGRIINVIRSLYSNLKSCLKVPYGLTEYFACVVGTRQGCMISPFLFILYLNELVRLLRDYQCPSIRIDNDFPDFSMLMYADDIALCNDTVGRLQRSIDILGIFCDKYGLKVNMSKTNVIVFRNGGILRQNEKFYYKGGQITCATYYKYLGIMYSSRLCWTRANQTLASQADRAVFAIKSAMKECGEMSVSLALDLFDKIISPILLYGSEIWGTRYAGSIEYVHRKFCKYVLNVSINASNAAVLGELGRRPLRVQYNFRCVKYWLTIVQDKSKRLRNSLYYVLKNLDDVGKQTWASEIKGLLYRNGFGHVWVNQGVGDVEHFLALYKQRLVDISTQEWHSDITENRKLDTYILYKSELSFETYLSIDIMPKHRISLSRFRCVNHNLAIEKMRSTHSREDRICKFCYTNFGSYVVEDDFHFVLLCPLYNHIRSHYIQKYFSHPSPATFISLISSKSHNVIRDIAGFLYHAGKLHRLNIV